MTYRSGPNCSPPRCGWQLISSRFYPEPIVITDDEIRADEAERETAERHVAEREQEREREQ